MTKEFFVSITVLVILSLIVGGCRSKGLKTENREMKVVRPKSKTTKEPSEEKKESRGTFLIADFNDCKKPNKLGGGFGAWDKDPKDFTQKAMDSFVSNIKHGEDGCSVQIAYDVISPNEAYNGFWMNLNGLDATEYNKFNFWVKGDDRRGFTKVFKVELKNTKGEVGKTYVTGLKDEWKKMTLPLSKFKQLTDFTTLKEFVIVFEDRIATAKEGAIYIDDIHLSK